MFKFFRYVKECILLNDYSMLAYVIVFYMHFLIFLFYVTIANNTWLGNNMWITKNILINTRLISTWGNNNQESKIAIYLV